jgi:dephospho-CoA kinase
MSYCIGLTGNIGSGKSTAIQVFQSLGVSIISADVIARELTAKDKAAYHLIKKRFGDKVILPNGELDRKQLREIIFSEKDARLELENMLHPLIKAKIQEQISQKCDPYCVIEIPLLYHRSDYPYLNKILMIETDLDTQVRRIMERDNCDKELTLAILKTQGEARLEPKLADDIVKNNGTKEDLKNAIQLLHLRYLDLANPNLLDDTK